MSQYNSGHFKPNIAYLKFVGWTHLRGISVSNSSSVWPKIFLSLWQLSELPSASFISTGVSYLGLKKVNDNISFDASIIFMFIYSAAGKRIRLQCRWMWRIHI